MQFLSPMAGLIAAGLTIPVLVLLYFLKLRRREMTVPSTLLWRQAIRDLEVNSPFQRLRRNLLLLLQLFVLAGLLLAFARPSTMQIARPGQQVIILIDHSASMNAVDVTPSRLDQAKRQALGLIDSLDFGRRSWGGGETAGLGAGKGGGAMVVSFAGSAQVRQPPTRDLARLRDAVHQIQPTDETADLSAALDLVEPFARQADVSGLVVYVISDGGAARADGHTGGGMFSLPNAQIRYLPIGSAEPRNVGWVTLTARRVVDQPEKVQVFARLASTLPQAATPTVTLRVDGQVVQAGRVALPAATADGPGTQVVRWELTLPNWLPGGHSGGYSGGYSGGPAGVVEVAHDLADDLAGDNRAWLVLTAPQQIQVLMISPGNVFLQRALEAAEQVGQVTVLSPDDLAARTGQGESAAAQQAALAASYDLVVLDRVSFDALEGLPDRPTLGFVNLPAVEGLARRERSPSAPAVQMMLDWDRSHPLLRHVAMDDLLMTEPGRLVLPQGATVLATAQSGPVLAELQQAGVSHVVASFDLMQTNWPMQVSFPVFISNAVQYLVLGEQARIGQSYRPGQVVHVTLPDDRHRLRYRGPTDLDARIVNQQATLGPLRRAGLYEARDDVPGRWRYLAVNVASQSETDIRTTESLAVTGSGAVGSAGQLGQAAAVQREWWRWFVWAALAGLLIEWTVYLRRMRG